MHEHELISHEQEADELWRDSAEKSKNFYKFVKAGQMQEFYGSVAREKRAAATKRYDVMRIVCMDERVDESMANAVVVRDGGDGVLRNSGIAQDIQKIIESPEQIAGDYIRLAKELGIKKVIVTRHDNCGACAISKKNPDEQKKYYLELIRALKEAGLQVDEDYITSKKYLDGDKKAPNFEGRRLAGMHDARMVSYINFTNPYNPQKISEWPSGFVVNRGIFNGANAPEEHRHSYPKANVNVALTLAFGVHGFGYRFSADQPFVLLAVGNDIASRDAAIAELEEVKENFIKELISAENFDKNSPYNREYFEQAIAVTGIIEDLAA